MGIYFDVRNVTRKQDVKTDTQDFPPDYIDIIAKIFGWDLENDIIFAHSYCDYIPFVKGKYQSESDKEDSDEKVSVKYILDPRFDAYRNSDGYLELWDPYHSKTLSKTTETNVLLMLGYRSPIKAHLVVEEKPYRHYWRYEIDDPMSEEEMKRLFERTESSSESDEPEADVVAGAGVESSNHKADEEKEKLELLTSASKSCTVCPHCAQPMPCT